MISLSSQQGHSTTSLGSIQLLGKPYLCYALLGALLLGLPWEFGLKDWEWYKNKVKSNKYIWWMHGTFTFGLMWLCQPKNLRTIFGSDDKDNNLGLLAVMQHGMVSLLAIVLWDFGYVNSGISMILVNCHHVGLFLAILFGPGWGIDAFVGDSSDEENYEIIKSSLERQVHLDTCMFGWLWMIHSFGFLLQVILPLLGIKLKEGTPSPLVTTIQHAYACGTVYFYQQYMNSNPNKFFTYQTCSLFIMLFGRYLTNSNWKHISYLRRIEFPGFWIVLVDRALGFRDTYCQRSLAIAFCGFAAYLLYAVQFKILMPKPNVYVGPNENPELKKFLEDETSKVRGSSLSPDELEKAKTMWIGKRLFAVDWWDKLSSSDETKLAEIYPVHNIVLTTQPGDQKDAEKLANLLDKIGEKALNQPVKEWYDGSPTEFSASISYSYECTLVLLKKGANPYLEDAIGQYAVRTGKLDPFGFSPIKPAGLGYSEGFWDRFDQICLEKSPPKLLSRKEKFRKIVQSL